MHATDLYRITLGAATPTQTKKINWLENLADCQRSAFLLALRISSSRDCEQEERTKVTGVEFMEEKSDVILTSYCGLLVVVLFLLPIFFINIGYLIVYPGIYYKNPFLIFTGLYADGEYLLFIGLIMYALIIFYGIYLAFISPFKLIFSDKGIRVYSLWFLRPLFLRWDELTEFQVIEKQRQTSDGGVSYHVQPVIVSKKFSTKSRGSLGPSFLINKSEISSNKDAAERILELYQKSQVSKVTG